MKSKIIIMIMAVIAVVSLSSCRGKAGAKAIEAAQKALKKTPKKSTTFKGGALLESGKYADDAARVVEEISEDDTYNFKDGNDD